MPADKVTEYVIWKYGHFEKFFETHLVGSLVDNCNLNEADAIRLVDDFKRRGLLEVVGRKFGTPLLRVQAAGMGEGHPEG